MSIFSGLIVHTFEIDVKEAKRNDDDMDRSHDTVVSPGDKVFAYGMNRIGWSFEVREFWVY